jgi:E3 ubiquitin-protein ligase mind-bomb
VLTLDGAETFNTLLKTNNESKNKMHQNLDLNSRNKKRQTALHVAVNKNHIVCVQVLLKLNAHPCLQDFEGDSPLHDAITKRHDHAVQLLLDANADLTLCNKYGFNIVHHATLRGNLSTMKLILDKIKSQEKFWLLDEKKEDGFGALHLACLNNYADLVKLFLEYGNLNINLRNLNLQTPLHLTVERLNFEIVDLLLNYRSKDLSSNQNNENRICNVNAHDKDGNTPLHNLLHNLTVFQVKKLKEMNEKDTSVNYFYFMF